MEFKNERELQEDLAKHLRAAGLLTYTEIDIKGGRSGRADIIAIKPSYANKDCRIYEVKNNRSTFDNDSKYEKYFDVCHRMYIACPAGMIEKSELPTKVGMIVRSEKGWHVVKGAKRNNPKDFNTDFILSLLYRGYEENLQQRKLRDRIVAKDNIALSRRAKNIGFEIARRLDKDRETEVERWVESCSELFQKHLGIDKRDFGLEEGLPSLYKLEDVLKSIDGFVKDIKYIKDIGEYLSKLNLPEEADKKKYFRKSRRFLRDKAMGFKEETSLPKRSGTNG